MTPVFCCGFECGQIGSGSGNGQHWNNNGTANNSFDTTIKRTGTRSLRINPTASQGSVINQLFSSQIFVVRFYVYFATIPNSDCTIFTTYAVSNRAGIVFKSADNSLYPGFYNSGFLFGSQGLAITSARWYQIDLLINTSANPWTVDLKIDGIPLAQATQASTAVAHTTMNLGVISATTTADIYYDDFICSNTSADYPIGNGSVQTFIPTSDGTHNVAGTGDFQRTLTGTDILNATTTAFQLIDDVPLESGASVDWINMVAPPNATDYVECIFGPAPNIMIPVFAPRAVEVIAGIHQAGTGTGNMEIRINDNGTTDAMYSATTVAGTTTVTYKRKHYATAITGGAWKITSGAGNFNNLRVRFGSPATVDANPDQYLDCIMVEAEFPEDPPMTLNNYQFPKSVSAGVISITEKIK